MSSIHPFLEQIDHVGIDSDAPETLFRFFAQDLGLPVFLPYTEYRNYLSGSVVLGNMYLELMHFGAPKRGDTLPTTARYSILGFLNKPGTIVSSMDELKRRGIPHSGLAPFFAPEATDQNPVAIWSNVFLGGLLGNNGWMRLFFSMSKQSEMKPSMQRSRLMSALSVFLMNRAFRTGMPVLTEYFQRTHEHRQAIGGAKMAREGGGILGVECVREVVVGIADEDAPARDLWANFLAPIPQESEGCYPLGQGPAIRLVSRSQPGIQTLVLKVVSLSKAKEAIARSKLQTVDAGSYAALALPHTTLTVRLIE